MQLSRRVALDGVQLDEQHARIAIQSIQSTAAKGNAGSAAARYGGSGSRRIAGHRESMEIVIGFSIVIKSGRAAEREEAVEAVNAWAAIARNGAWLTASTKPGRQIRVWLDEPAAMGDARSDPQKTMTVRFKAYGVPNWQETDKRSAVIGAGSTGAGTLEIGGNAPTCAEITMQNISGQSLRWAECTVGTSRIRLEDISLGANESIRIDHDDEGLIRIRIQDAYGGYRSILAKRTGASANDYWVTPGMAAVSFQSERACRVTAEVRGRFL